MEGFHKLTGAIRTTYTTGAETKILNFTGVTGPEDGSVILSFTSDGPKPESWTLTYQAEGEAPQTRSFSGQNVTVPGLTVGKTYTFQLTAGEGYYLTGNSLTYTVSPAVVAQNLRVTGHTSGAMTLAWDQPETPVTGWTVRCYNSSGFDQSVTVTGCSATIEGRKHRLRRYEPKRLDCHYRKPHFHYRLRHPGRRPQPDLPGLDPRQPCSRRRLDPPVHLRRREENTEALQTVESAAVISTVLPNTTYTFSIQAPMGPPYSTASTPSPRRKLLPSPNMVWTPARCSWPPSPLRKTRTGPPGTWSRTNKPPSLPPSSSIAFVLEATQGMGRSDEEVETLILVRDAQGIPVDYYIGSAQWHHVDQRQISGAAGADAPNPPATISWRSTSTGGWSTL